MSDDTTIALVTGANKGIGKEVARQLGARGAVVWLGTRDEARGRAAEAELRAEGADARWVQLDVTDGETIAAAAKRVESEHGRLDVLVNNAAVAGADASVRPSQVPVDAVREVFEANVFGPIGTTNAFLPLVRRSPRGRVVNVSSNLASLALAEHPTIPGYDAEAVLLAYNSSKTALNMATALLARELAGTTVKVNAVDPGYCATDLNDHRGVLSPAEGAEVVVSAATLGDDGPSGAFFGAEGRVAW